MELEFASSLGRCNSQRKICEGTFFAAGEADLLNYDPTSTSTPSSPFPLFHSDLHSVLSTLSINSGRPTFHLKTVLKGLTAHVRRRMRAGLRESRCENYANPIKLHEPSHYMPKQKHPWRATLSKYQDFRRALKQSMLLHGWPKRWGRVELFCFLVHAT